MGVFAMPSLGADMEAGKLVEWLVAPGDTVARGDVVAVVETQKGAIEIECFEAGVVQELMAGIGTELPVGAPLALILAEGESPPAEPVQEAPPSEPAPEAADQQPSQPEIKEPPTPVKPMATSSGAPPSSPAARQRARDLGIDLSGISGSGPNGAIQLADVEQRIKQKPARSPQGEMRRAIAAAMTRSKQTIPHFYISQTIDLFPAMTWLSQRNEGRPPSERVLLGALFLRAMVRAALKVPTMNGHVTEDGFVPAPQVNAGLAVALRSGGLVAPAILNAETLDLDGTMAAMRDLVTRARAGRLRNREMSEGTITLSSLGETGAESMAGVIFPPQAALVGLGAPQIRPWVVDGEVVPRHVVTLTLSADHRVNDGRLAARFIAEFETQISAPESL